MSFPFAGEPGGAATGFAISYGAGWGQIPLLIGLDFMFVSRSNQATTPIRTVDGRAVLPRCYP